MPDAEPENTTAHRGAAELDAVDRQIVHALRSNGRLSMRALAEQLHISRAGA
ncbi:MAG: hypothetical protein QOH56_1954, partial [Pseudonocardiales bacterium]|nr:hypothetical protein [Pseudonocardiales bacterium]